jgi:uncharacterized tellurite resistance protein B-like protein
MEFVIVLFVIVFYLIFGGSKSKNRSKKNQFDKISSQELINSVKRGHYTKKSKLLNNPQKFWVPADKKIKIKGYSISKGFIYVGENLSSVGKDYWNGVEPALINPNLPIDKSNPDYEGHTLSYWPSYSGFTPTGRAAYLEWLSSDRDNRETPIGYVFTYYYGLERRVLSDVNSSTIASNEVALLLKELERLLTIYGSNNSFKRYCSNLLEFYYFKNISKNTLEDAVKKENVDYSQYDKEYYYSMNFKMGLAHFALNEIPLPWEWALKWANHQGYFRTPATRCKKELAKLFSIEYEKRFGKGKIIKPCKTKIKLSYHPASRTFVGQSLSQETNIPDITRFNSNIVNEFNDIVNDCTNKLDSYSRYLGRNPDKRDSPEAISNLPPELITYNLNDELQELFDEIDSQLDDKEFFLLDTKELAKHWEIKGKKYFRKKESTEIAEFFFKLGFGIEPDLRFGSAKVERDSKIVIFKINQKTFPKSPTKEFKLALIILQLTTTVGMADGTFSVKEKELLDQNIENLFSFSQEKKKRLEAYLIWLQNEKAGTRGIKNKIQGIDKNKKASIMHYLIKVANADGYVDPLQVEALQIITGILELDTDNIYKQIHTQQTTSGDKPVLIIKGESRKGHVIPKEDVEKLDKDLINKTLSETEEVQSILSEIFTENSSDHVQDNEVIEKEKSNSILGLDELHAKLVKKLLKKSEWERSEYERLCSDLGLFPDGALEVINTKSFEQFDDELLLDMDQIEINTEIANEFNL